MDADQAAALYQSFSPELLGGRPAALPAAGDVVDDAVQHAFLQLQVAAHTPHEPRAWLRPLHGTTSLTGSGPIEGW